MMVAHRIHELHCEPMSDSLVNSSTSTDGWRVDQTGAPVDKIPTARELGAHATWAQQCLSSDVPGALWPRPTLWANPAPIDSRLA
jgi:hypothetical protein